MNIKIDIDEKWYIKFSQQKSSGELELIYLHQFIDIKGSENS